MSLFPFFAKLFNHSAKKVTLADDLVNIQHQQLGYLLACESLDAAELLSQYPPKIEHTKKQLLFALALARGLHGQIVVRRYREIPLPATYQPFVPETEIAARKGFFRYSLAESANDWFMNFADHHLFHGYGNFQFAQDEIQVAEHPGLASVREMMLQRGDALRPLTVENGSPTPVLICGVQRTVDIDSRSIYGVRFARSEFARIQERIRNIEPPSRSRILAIEAPVSRGNARYSRSEIQHALLTAYSGFRAAVLVDMTDPEFRRPTVIHTGNWGCGAYGGNRQLMLSVQMMAARLAGVARVIFYCGADSTDDVGAFDIAVSKRFKFKPNANVISVVNRLVGEGLKWGRPDGN